MKAIQNQTSMNAQKRNKLIYKSVDFLYYHDLKLFFNPSTRGQLIKSKFENFNEQLFQNQEQNNQMSYRKNAVDFPNYFKIQIDKQNLEDQQPEQNQQYSILNQNRSLNYGQLQSHYSLINRTSEYIGISKNLESETKQGYLEILRELINLNVDCRRFNNLKMIFLSEDIHGQQTVTVDQFKSIMSKTLRQQDYNEKLQCLMIQNLKNEQNQIDYKKLSQLLDFYNYHYFSMKPRPDPKLGFDPVNNLPKESSRISWYDYKANLQGVMTYFWGRVSEKFEKITKIYKYFDIHNRGYLSYNDFKFAIEKLQIKLSNEDVYNLFQYIDNNGDGKVCFNEFCILSQDYDPERLKFVKSKDYAEIYKQQQIEQQKLQEQQLLLERRKKKQRQTQNKSAVDFSVIHGIKTNVDKDVASVIAHSYVNQIKDYQQELKELDNIKVPQIFKNSKHTNASQLRMEHIKLKKFTDLFNQNSQQSQSNYSPTQPTDSLRQTRDYKMVSRSLFSQNMTNKINNHDKSLGRTTQFNEL